MQKIPPKHKEVYREKDALRKTNYRQKIKANPIAKEERLRVQRDKKTKVAAASQRKYSYCYCSKSCDKTKRRLCFFTSPHKIKEHPESWKNTPKKR